MRAVVLAELAALAGLAALVGLARLLPRAVMAEGVGFEPCP